MDGENLLAVFHRGGWAAFCLLVVSFGHLNDSQLFRHPLGHNQSKRSKAGIDHLFGCCIGLLDLLVTLPIYFRVVNEEILRFLPRLTGLVCGLQPFGMVEISEDCRLQIALASLWNGRIESWHIILRWAYNVKRNIDNLPNCPTSLLYVVRLVAAFSPISERPGQSRWLGGWGLRGWRDGRLGSV